MYHGVDWIYTYTHNILSFDFNLWYFWLSGFLFGASNEIFFKTLWFFTFNVNNLQLLMATVLDQYLINTNLNLFYDDFWFKSFLSSKDTTLILTYHPELIFITSGLKNHLINEYSTNFFTVLLHNDMNEGFLSPVLFFLQFIIYIYIVSLLITFLFSFFSAANTEENLIDHDFLINSLIIESEEEIASFDDMLIAGIIFFYIFSWYFYFNFAFLLTWLPETMLVLYLFPGIYYIIIFIPTLLLYDFGLFFISYLRGVGASSVILFELVFDYIAFLAFYIRLSVQGVRLILMIFVYVSLHDLILYYSVNPRLFLGNDSFWDDLSNLSVTYESFSYFLFTKLPGKIFYWLYELAHTFFVVTAQFIAFFAMVFWLFFFLYTFFVFEKFENYFQIKREKRSEIFKKIYFFKN